MKKKLQVFLSSTYKDMRLERQGAVEAILESGHIPAGMELFSSDNKKQFEVIKKWIRECDVFILILGGRYGSVEKGLTKSYIQREYEYAKHIGKKPIAIMLSENGMRNKIAHGDYSLSEKEYLSAEYLQFKRSILDSKLCTFFDDIPTMKSCIFNSLKNFENNDKISGWIKSNSANTVFEYPYILENQEFTFKYIDLTTIEYTKRFQIRYLVDGIQYYTDRYSWNAEGSIKKELENPSYKIVDEFSDGAFTAYSIRLDEPSKKGKVYDIVVRFYISNSKYIQHQYLGLGISFPAKNIKLRMEIPEKLELQECKYNVYSHSLDRVPTKTGRLLPKTNSIEKTFHNISIGQRYNIEWKIYELK